MTAEEVRAILAQIPAARFKTAFISWFAESEHQGWGGYNPTQVMDFEVFMEDFALYVDNGGLEEFGGFLTFGGVQLDINWGDPPLTEEEEKAFDEWMDAWSPSDAYNMLPDMMAPSDKRAYIKEMREMQAEDELSETAK